MSPDVDAPDAAGLRAASDFFADTFGLAGSRGKDIWKNRRFAFLTDRLYDLRLAFSPKARRLRALAGTPRRRILVIAVRVDSRKELMDQLVASLSRTRHDVTFRIKSVGGLGKLDNMNMLLDEADIAGFDWVIAADDDIVVPDHFLDLFITTLEAYDMKVGMPAHKFASYSGYEVTRRAFGTVARATNFVEVGPFVAFARETYDAFFPFPSLKYGWGVDISWGAIAKARGWRMGISDLSPMRHVRPIGATYPREDATAEAIGYVARAGFLPRRETFAKLERF
jgi:hypothetical protein